MPGTKNTTESIVASRYSAAAQAVEPELCCPVDYDAQYLKIIPDEVIERDYGCGDPSKHVREGETVLDLGSGGGKICFIASQIVGEHGHVIGVDMNDTMLELARQSQPQVAEKLGYDNITFHKGRIQDMAVDRDRVDQYLREHPIANESGLRELESFISIMRKESPMIPNDSVDVVVSNCVLNLVDESEKESLFKEILRVLRPGGRAVISDIVSDKSVPQHMRDDPELWSGCLSGAFRDQDFVQAFREVGLHGVYLYSMQTEPWRVVEGIEFRSATVIAYKARLNDADEATPHVHAAIYRGPFRSITLETGEVFESGNAQYVNQEKLDALQREPYADHFVTVKDAIDPGKPRSGLPMADQTKQYHTSESPDGCCGSQGCC